MTRHTNTSRYVGCKLCGRHPLSKSSLKMDAERHIQAERALTLGSTFLRCDPLIQFLKLW